MVFDVSLAQLLTLLVNFILPVIVGLVARVETSAGKKAIGLAGLAVVTAFLSEWIQALANNTPFLVGSALFTAITGFVVAVATHYGLWKPTGVSDKALEIGS